MADNGKNGQSSALIMPLVELEDVEVDPLLLALLHCSAYLDLSDDDSVDPEDAGEALEHMAHYVRLLSDERLDQVQEQLDELADHGESEGWPEELVEFVRDFLVNCGAIEDDEDEEADGDD